MNMLVLAIWFVVLLGVARMVRGRDWFDYFVGSELIVIGVLAGILLFAPAKAVTAWWILFVVVFTVVESIVLVAFLVRARHSDGPLSPGEESIIPPELIEGEFNE